MKTLIRRIRGIAVTSLTWAIGWGVAGAVLLPTALALDMLRRGLGMDGVRDIVLRAVLGGGVFGAVSGMFAGASFAVILSVLEQRRGLAELSLRRTAVWGALGGVALPALQLGIMTLVAGAVPAGGMASFLAVSGLLGATFAAGTLAVARRGEGAEAGGEDASRAAPGQLSAPSPFDTVPTARTAVREAAGG